jgi:hypothetical protein
MLTENDAIEQIRQGNLQLSPLQVELVDNTQWQKMIDAVVAITWDKEKHLFAAEYKALSTPKEFASAIDQVLRTSHASGLHPLILMPYLNERQLDELTERQISGVDFCGNGVVVIPHQILVLRSGKPNLFPASAAIKNVYRKNSSLVSRAFLAQPIFKSVGDIEAFIQMHGGHEAAISLSTVSKALKALEEDLIVSREKGTIRLIQPEKLLDKLVTNFAKPFVRRFLVGKSPSDIQDLMHQLVENSTRHQVWLTGTGVGSANQYATMARENFLSVYCTDLYRLLAGVEFKETTRFPNLEIVETVDRTVYFDTRFHKGFGWASPVQTYLELMVGGQREQDIATQVKPVILTESTRSLHEPAF